MIPPFQADGNLPPGIHTATWGEVARRFGGNPRRDWLLAGLRRALDNLQSAGCRRVYLNGSLVTSKPLPDAFDACWETAGVDVSKVSPLLLDRDDLFRNRRRCQKSEFGGELIPDIFHWSNVLEFFQRDPEGRPKGIILIDLGENGYAYENN